MFHRPFKKSIISSVTVKVFVEWYCPYKTPYPLEEICHFLTITTWSDKLISYSLGSSKVVEWNTESNMLWLWLRLVHKPICYKDSNVRYLFLYYHAFSFPKAKMFSQSVKFEVFSQCCHAISDLCKVYSYKKIFALSSSMVVLKKLMD